jgi:hypothetical protein
LLLKGVNILLLNFDIYYAADYDPDLAIIVEKTTTLLFSNQNLLNSFKDSNSYSYLLYSVYAYERGLHFGNTMLSGKKLDSVLKNYFETKFFSNTLNLIREICLDEAKDIKEQQSALPPFRVEGYLKWLFFYTSESENIIIINSYLKIIQDVYKTCKIYDLFNYFLLKFYFRCSLGKRRVF